jgi:1,2-diacylglycerol 3-beta-galactosyltransferase
MQQELSARQWPVPVIVKGFVTDIWNWMAACDCVVSKAGPGTIAEALSLGKPLLLTDYIRGQETGNVPYVLKHGVGVYAEDPWQIAEVLSGWFGAQRASLEQLAQNAARLGKAQAAFGIVEEIAALLKDKQERLIVCADRRETHL